MLMMGQCVLGMLELVVTSLLVDVGRLENVKNAEADVKNAGAKLDPGIKSYNRIQTKNKNGAASEAPGLEPGGKQPLPALLRAEDPAARAPRHVQGHLPQAGEDPEGLALPHLLLR